jgi:undecaprenyl-diphosphatase
MKLFLQNLSNSLVMFGPMGLFFLTLIDSSGVPLPGVIDLLLVQLAAHHPAGAPWYAALAIVGSVMGTMILYFLARKGGEAFLDRRTAHGRGAQFKRWYLQYGLVTVFVPAISVVPLPMKVPVFCAGALGVRPSTIAGVVFVARLVRYSALAWLGAELGENSMTRIVAYKWYLLSTVGALALMLIIYLRFSGRKRALGPTYH